MPQTAYRADSITMPREATQERPNMVTCPQCHGTGQIIDDDGTTHVCPLCRGQGEVSHKVALDWTRNNQ